MIWCDICNRPQRGQQCDTARKCRTAVRPTFCGPWVGGFLWSPCLVKHADWA